MLYVINKILNCDVFFYIYITIEFIFFIFFSEFFVIFIFVVIVLVQFCIIIVKNSMFYEKHKSSCFVTIFCYVIDTVYIYPWKNIGKNLTHFGDALC